MYDLKSSSIVLVEALEHGRVIACADSHALLAHPDGDTLYHGFDQSASVLNSFPAYNAMLFEGLPIAPLELPFEHGVAFKGGKAVDLFVLPGRWRPAPAEVWLSFKEGHSKERTDGQTMAAAWDHAAKRLRVPEKVRAAIPGLSACYDRLAHLGCADLAERGVASSTTPFLLMSNSGDMTWAPAVVASASGVPR